MNILRKNKVGFFLCALGLALGTSSLAGAATWPATWPATWKDIQCDSRDDRRAECLLDQRGPHVRVLRVELLRRDSRKFCTLGQSFGVTAFGMWIDHGCRGLFRVHYDDGSSSVPRPDPVPRPNPRPIPTPAPTPAPTPGLDCTLRDEWVVTGDGQIRTEYVVLDSLGREIGRTLEYSFAVEILNQARAQGRCYSGGNLPPYPPLPPQPPVDSVTGYSCSAACASYNGVPDLRTIEFGIGAFELEARQNATSAVNRSRRCNYNIVQIECSPSYRFAQFDSSAACTSFNGNLDLRNIGYGSGPSLAQAKAIALQQAQANFRCNYGVKVFEESHLLTPSYCTAACVDFSGKLDPRYSRGMRGRSEVEAKFNALSKTQSDFKCTYGVQVSECSRESSAPPYFEGVDSSAACRTYDGKLDLRTVALGRGANTLEAREKALTAARVHPACLQFGVAEYQTTQDLRPSYCVANCTDFSGGLDPRFSRGANGRSQVEARVQALLSTQSAFACRHGVEIQQCSY